jgi:aminoglycoside phosphotransferase family enzyme
MRLMSYPIFFVNQFARASGDSELLSYINFYKCYRAYVRGKINLFTAADDAVGRGKRRTTVAGSWRAVISSWPSVIPLVEG